MGKHLGTCVSISVTQNPIPLCCDCKHYGEDGFCEKVRTSQSFARQSREQFACGPWGNLFESGEANE